MEDAEIDPKESEHFNPDRSTEHRMYNMSREVGIEARTVELTNHANRISESDYFALIRSLNKKHWILNDLSKGLTALAPNYWKVLFSFHELTEIMRQKDDLEFPQLLNSLRQNQLTEKDFAVLGTRTVPVNDPTYRTNATHLPSIIWVKFEDARIGANNRRKYSHLYGKDVDKTWTPMFEIKRSFTYKYKTFERIQFPLRPEARKTIHQSQGDTLHKVVFSLKSKRKGKIPHIHYVALSRVTSLTGLQILDLKQEAIAIAECVRQELHRLRTDATLQLCFKPLYNLSSSYFKVVFNSSRSLHAHFDDLKSEPNILDADVIGIAESRLISTDENDYFYVPGFCATSSLRPKANKLYYKTTSWIGIILSN
ncbi:unnamed protein product [Mytilus coruscus]|uniref:Uncharacterized protein n=1 Tax=Mytilus coruscus TaxID=42192 RepID=A0A6J8C9U3_MYTCO|nr:unnamed protein product [Mytilus coruscus]